MSKALIKLYHVYFPDPTEILEAYRAFKEVKDYLDYLLLNFEEKAFQKASPITVTTNDSHFQEWNLYHANNFLSMRDMIEDPARPVSPDRDIVAVFKLLRYDPQKSDVAFADRYWTKIPPIVQQGPSNLILAAPPVLYLEKAFKSLDPEPIHRFFAQAYSLHDLSVVVQDPKMGGFPLAQVKPVCSIYHVLERKLDHHLLARFQAGYEPPTPPHKNI